MIPHNPINAAASMQQLAEKMKGSWLGTAVIAMSVGLLAMMCLRESKNLFCGGSHDNYHRLDEHQQRNWHRLNTDLDKHYNQHSR